MTIGSCYPNTARQIKIIYSKVLVTILLNKAPNVNQHVSYFLQLFPQLRCGAALCADHRKWQKGTLASQIQTYQYFTM